MSQISKRRRKPAGNKSRTKVFRDPVHDLIRIEKDDLFILDLIDTKEFQRLRRIRQLGLCHFVYPSAEHTRFAHSLGVFNFARRMIERLLERCDDRTTRDELAKSSQTIKAAALLHDVGHGPFSHVFERVFESDCPSHEEWSVKILEDESTELHKKLVEAKLDIEKVVQLISDKEDGAPLLVPPYQKDIVSSQLDADRMDYLLRDSIMTGSRYGEYDSEWILNVLAIAPAYGDEEAPKKLCLDGRKGLGSIERMLHARALMTLYVYGHKATRAYEAELINTLRLAMELAEHLPQDTPDPVRLVLEKKGRLSVPDYLMLDDEVMWWALRRWAVWEPEQLSEPKKELASALSRHALRLARRHPPWKTVSLTGKRNKREAPRMVQRYIEGKDGLRFECYLDEMTIWPYKDPAFYVRKRDGKDHEDSYFKDIYLLDEEGLARPIQEDDESPVLKGLSEEQIEYRFHYDRSHKEEFAGLLKKFGVC